ncbi:MAG TPA: hypothetical protein VJ250_00870 [Nitrososphaeraceae archaeon]|nr:hypothetical protein [Nitrososphaeraceae archaeon]
MIEEIDALKDPEPCETINVQVVANFVTNTFYRNELKILIHRELIPPHVLAYLGERF